MTTLREAAGPHGEWRLHHYPAEAALVPMWTAIAAEALARVIGTGRSDRLGICTGRSDRLGICTAPACERVSFDRSRNGSRRFCGTTCQNRVKAAAFRRRHRDESPAR